MSTFGGVMLEFPDVRVDFFRPVDGYRPPLACFLSHVHSDHLAGLESLKSPFIYCSAATKELLLRLERYPHRLNFELGILEARKQTYKHLQKLLKPIPLETPTRIELQPDKYIQVTLFDANHCTGAVMFLFEGDGKAVLYTGDIRSEPWFVNSLTRNPFLIEYTSGLKTLDCIYLDTSNTGPMVFPTKADGIRELLQKVSKYPPDTVFHFTAWTFGYEEVWMALSKALESPIHVDRYKLRLYQSLRGESSQKGQFQAAFLAHEGPVLTGYVCGNMPQEGCLTDDHTVRLHSCEKGMHCPTVNDKTVWIKPIIARTSHGEVQEVGVGGGGGDLAQRPELEIDNRLVVDRFLSLFGDTEDVVLHDIKAMLTTGPRPTSFAVSLDDMGLDRQEDDLPLSEFKRVILKSVAKRRNKEITPQEKQEQGLPRTITFPYSRHSSFPELCDLVRVFRPKDVYACTVDARTWHEGTGIRNLFGKHCSGSIFRHDVEMRKLVAEIAPDLEDQQTRTTASTQSSPNVSPVFNHRSRFPSLSARPTSEVNPQGNTRRETPPKHILAVSPGSASQSLRRRSILDGLGEREVKRARLQMDGPDSSPLGHSGGYQKLTLQNPEIQKSRSISAPRSPSRGHTPSSESEMNKDGLETPDEVGSATSITPSNEELNIFDIDDNPVEFDENYTFFDYEDQVLRCRFCGYEVWTSGGFCTGIKKGCRSGLETIPYYETLESEDVPRTRPAIAVTEYSEETIEDPVRRNIVGNYLDDDTSAYDSQDLAGDHIDEYDSQDSFIDDASQADAHTPDDSSSTDGETDWKGQFRQLQATHNLLLNDYSNLADGYDDLRRDIFRSDFESNSDMDDERDDSGMLVVDVAVPDPIVAELVLSQAEAQSQNSTLASNRLRDRVEAFEAASSVHGWHNISLVSTQDK